MKSWLQPPRLRVGEGSEEHRHATWLELFYDLVFVVAISQLARNLHDHVSLSGFFGFIVLFLPIWWAWIGTTFYANRFDGDDIGHRLLMGLQMIAIAALAVNVHDGLSKSSAGFALAYAASRILLVTEYLRAAMHINVARPLATRYAQGFALAATLWLISAFIPVEWCFVLWTLGLLVDFATPLTASKLVIGLPPHTGHLPERFGLFTIIVLGEAIIAVVDGVAEQEWDLPSAIAAVFGLGIAFSLWWIYFDNVGGAPIRNTRADGWVSLMYTWLYTHLPLVIGIAATGVGVEHVVASEAGVALPDNYRWLLCGSVGLCFIALGILHRTGVIRYCKTRSKHRSGGAAVLLIIAIFGRGLLPLTVIALVTFVCAVQVFQDMYQNRPTTRLSDPV